MVKNHIFPNSIFVYFEFLQPQNNHW